MKILSCYITGFGKFEKQSFNFTSGLNCIHGENGWGKTTLAEFIASMLYGIDGGRSKNISVNTRLHYAPFTSAQFGGTLTFEYAGRAYRIERFFGKTPAFDSVKIYDKNNMPCYDFGDKAEKLGETLLGMDKDSFTRCVYLPQGESGGELTGDIKTRLVSLLSVNGAQSGAQSALERLENAERALRAKRKPAKGKLDEIDEKMQYYREKQAECLRAQEQYNQILTDTQTLTSRVNELKTQLQSVSEQIAEYTQKSQRLAKLSEFSQIRAKRDETKERLNRLQEFFNQTNAQTVNLAGLKTAVDEYYAVKAEIDELQKSVEEFSDRATKIESVKTRISVNEEMLQNYKEMMAQQNKKADKDKPKRKRRRKGDSGNFFLVLSLVVAMFGAMLLETRTGLAIALLSVGAIGIIVLGSIMVQGAGQSGKYAGVDKALRNSYEELFTQTLALKKELVKLMQADEEQLLLKKIEEKKARLLALDNAIKSFLSNFAFGEIYDYRSAYQTLQERIDDYISCASVIEECNAQLGVDDSADDESVGAWVSGVDIDALRQSYARQSGEMETLTAQTARRYAEAENYEKIAVQLQDFRAQEQRLALEKTRLENKLVAIKTAKELLIRARANMASRYLQPVEKKVREYAQILGFPFGEIVFSADGQPLITMQGATREMDYYSVGLQDLLWLCVRLALVETLFTKELPPLLLDDPFVNLDDDKTARVKALVKTLSSKFQVIYLTCKKDRNL